MEERVAPRSFIEEFIEQDIQSGKVSQVITRYPPEPNGYPHIGHAKAFWISSAMSQTFGGYSNLRFDDTNPAKEDTEYVEAIKRDIRWIGCEWKNLYFASDYYEETYNRAELLIRKGKAYVCDLSPEQLKATRGTLTTPGTNSPYRERTVEENLDLFRRMRAGEFPDGARILRAKIDMASPNINMRDPALYRIMRAHHHRTGDAWCIYPMYDFAHPIGDAIEGITHSLCSMEYEDHRPLYDWVVHECEFEHKPRQIEFARLNITDTVMSKRYLRRIVETGLVDGWDDPRMPTLCAMRRRGYTPSAIQDFLTRVGIAKANSVVDARLLDHCVREELGNTTPRVMAVLRPLRVTLTNWPADRFEDLTVENHPDHPEMGERVVRFGRTLYIEREDFMENPPGKFFRLAPGREVRLKSAYIVRCDEVVKDASGDVVELLCSVDMDSRSGMEGANRKVKGTLHWVEASSAVAFEARLYEAMIRRAEADASEEPDELDEYDAPDAGRDDFLKDFNPHSMEVLEGCLAEASLGEARCGQTFQFMRMGYFCRDANVPDRIVFLRTVTLKDSWAKIAGK